MGALDVLEVRALASSEDRETWLAARRNVITATEAKVLVTGAAGEKAKILEEKVSGESSFAGNRYTENGNRREPVILDWLAASGWIGCGILYAAEQNPRHAATPDAIRLDFDGDAELAEIKTSKHDVAPGTDAYERAGYFFQMQWQMYCVGARRVLYVWEQHNDDWSGWPEVGPVPLGEPRTEWVERDEKVIAKMIVAANRALVKLDALVEAKDLAPVIDEDVDTLAVNYLRGLASEKEGAELKTSSFKELMALVETDEDFVQESPLARVSFSAATTEDRPVVEIDVEAAKAAAPALYEGLSHALDDAEQARLAVDREQAAVVVHEKAFTRQVGTTQVEIKKKALRVTAGKLTKETKK